jgi:ribosomal protein L16/L10AE
MSKKRIFKNQLLIKKWHSKNRFVGSSRKEFIFSENNFVRNKNSLIALCHRNLSDKQVETLRRCVKKSLKKTSKVLVHVHGYLGRTAKASGIRMGNGKGAKGRDQIGQIYPGKILLTVLNSHFIKAKQAIRRSLYKLNFKMRIVLILKSN